LLSLKPAQDSSGPNQVRINRDAVESFGVGTVIRDGKVGTVADFQYQFGANGTAQFGGSDTVTVLGTAGGSDVLVATEYTSEGGAGRRLTQAFRVLEGGDQQSMAERKRLFQNAVWWLLNCRICSNLGLHPEGVGLPATVGAGELLTYNLTL